MPKVITVRETPTVLPVKHFTVTFTPEEARVLLDYYSHRIPEAVRRLGFANPRVGEVFQTMLEIFDRELKD